VTPGESWPQATVYNSFPPTTVADLLSALAAQCDRDRNGGRHSPAQRTALLAEMNSIEKVPPRPADIKTSAESHAAAGHGLAGRDTRRLNSQIRSPGHARLHLLRCRKEVYELQDGPHPGAVFQTT